MNEEIDIPARVDGDRSRLRDAGSPEGGEDPVSRAIYAIGGFNYRQKTRRD
jgi:hypothetical protein